MTVRPAEPADLTAVGRLGAMLVTEHHEFDPKRFLAPRPDMAELYGRFLGSQSEQPDKLVLVAERDGAVVGYAYAGVEGNDYMALRGPAGVIYDLVVDPDHRRQGIGTALLDAVQSGACHPRRAACRAVNRRAQCRRPANVRKGGVPAHDDRNDSRADRDDETPKSEG